MASAAHAPGVPRMPRQRALHLSLPRPATLLLALAAGVPCASAPAGLIAQDAPISTMGVLVSGNLNDAPRPHAQAVRATGRIDIDGRLDDAAWAAAQVIDRFIQQTPVTGAAVSERTEVRILYDDENLYIGAEMYDSSPSEIVHTSIQPDPNTAQGDVLGFSLDTFLDGKNGYVFFVNPGGAVRDVQTADDGRVRNLAWDTSWEARTRIHEGGWTVEMRIPWSSLRFKGGLEEQVWGLNIMRRIRRRNEEASWAPLDRRFAIYDVSRSGTLGGLIGIQPGRNLALKPWVLASRPAGSLQSDADSEFSAGADLKYGITPGLTLDLSYNTDFSQVEVDQPQVNLTRFSLFFPEQREFFLENAATFQFGDQQGMGQRAGASNRDFTLFHSRRIGLTPSGAPLPILGGGRVSGTVGPLSLGLLNMQTRREGSAAAENFTVARVRGAPQRNLRVGGIFVNRTASSSPADNRSYGVDADFTALNSYLLVQSYLAATEGTTADGVSVDRDYASRLSVAWRDPLWEVVTLYRQLGDDFDPRVGFVRRRGVRHVYSTVGLRPVVAWGPIQEVNPYVETHYFGALGGGTETRESTAGLDAEFRDGATLGVNVTDRFENVRRAFSTGGAAVAAGEYDFREGSVSYGSSGGRALSGRVTVGGGGYYGGDRLSVGGNVVGRLGYRAFLNLTAEHNRIELPGQTAVDAAVYSARADYFFSTRFVTSGLFRYDEVSGELVTDLRINWVHAPLSDLYLVLTERRDTNADLVLERLITLKVTRNLPF